MSSSLVVRDYTIKCEEEVGCLEFKPRPCINYAMSLPIELSSGTYIYSLLLLL